MGRRRADGIVAGDALQHRVDGGAEVGAEHQGEGGVGRDGALGGERHDQQDDGDRGMRRPGQAGGDQDVEHRLGGDGAEQQTQAGHVLVGRDQRDELVQRHQHQAEADGDAADIARCGRQCRGGTG